MKITVIIASQRVSGKNKEIIDCLTRLNLSHELEFIRMAQMNINGCTSCYKCAETNSCVINDDFEYVFKRLKESDAIFIISPVYTVISSKLTALFERLTSLLFATKMMNTDANPFLNKPTAIFSYCSNGICDETQMKVIPKICYERL